MTLTTPGQTAPNGGRDGRQPPWRWAPERAAHDRNGDGWWMWWMCFPPSRPLLRQMRTGGGCRRTRTSTTDNILRLNTLRGGKRLVVDVQDLAPKHPPDSDSQEWSVTISLIRTARFAFTSACNAFKSLNFGFC